MKPHYCFFDTETTGLHYNAEIISIALVFTDEEYRVLKSHVRHFQPVSGISERVAEINGYDRYLWDHRIEAECHDDRRSEWYKIFDMLSDCKIMIAQNNAFDICRLLATVYNGEVSPWPWEKLPRTLDLASYARLFMTNKGYNRDYNSLSKICEACGVPYEGAHDALADTLMTLNCWQHIEEYYKTLEIVK